MCLRLTKLDRLVATSELKRDAGGSEIKEWKGKR